MTARASTFSLTNLPLSGKSGKDFGWGFAGRQSRRNSFNRIGADDNAPTIKPVLNVASPSRPFEIVRSEIHLVLVFVMDHLKPKRIRYECHRNESVNQNCSDLAVLGKFDLGVIAATTDAWHPNSSANKSVLSLPVINHAIETQDSAKIAYAIKSFISFNVLPLFIRERLKLACLLRKKLKDGLLNVEHFGFSVSLGGREVRDHVAVIDRGPKKLLRNSPCDPVLPMLNGPSKTSNAMLRRDFVNPFVARDGLPFFGFVAHAISPLIRLSTKTGVWIWHIATLVNSEILRGNSEETVVCR